MSGEKKNSGTKSFMSLAPLVSSETLFDLCFIHFSSALKYSGSSSLREARSPSSPDRSWLAPFALDHTRLARPKTQPGACSQFWDHTREQWSYENEPLSEATNLHMRRSRV